MVDLHYPDKKDKIEMFPLIDDEGNVMGRASRAYFHGGSMALHPVVHLHITDLQGRIYLQKRSMTKDIAPGRWDTAVGGHVSFGEGLEEAVRREANHVSFSSTSGSRSKSANWSRRSTLFTTDVSCPTARRLTRDASGPTRNFATNWVVMSSPSNSSSRNIVT